MREVGGGEREKYKIKREGGRRTEREELGTEIARTCTRKKPENTDPAGGMQIERDRQTDRQTWGKERQTGRQAETERQLHRETERE